MSESNDTEAADDLQAIRERKLEQLKAKAERGELGRGVDDEAGETGPETQTQTQSQTETETQTQTQAPTEPIHFDGGSLASTAGEYDVTLVDFYADWCGPCQMLAPVIDTIAAETAAAVIKVDADTHQDCCRSFGVQGLPTLILFTDGEPVQRLVGAQSENDLRELIRRYT